jgi:uncharacterized membrane protein YjgN (DUF898 family)
MSHWMIVALTTLCVLPIGVVIGVTVAAFCAISAKADAEDAKLDADATISQLYRDNARRVQLFTVAAGRCTCGALDDWREQGIGRTQGAA